MFNSIYYFLFIIDIYYFSCFAIIFYIFSNVTVNTSRRWFSLSFTQKRVVLKEEENALSKFLSQFPLIWEYSSHYTVQQNLGHVLSLGYWLSDFIRWLSKPPKRPFFPL